MTINMSMGSIDSDLFPTKARLAYLKIREEIISGTLRPGELLDQEQLATSIGLSTTPVREALRLLESEGLVHNRPHKNTIVAPLDFNLLEQNYAVRRSLDPLAASLTATHATESQRQLIQELFDQEATPPESFIASHKLNRAFHRAIYTATGNTVLSDVLDKLHDQTDRYRLFAIENDSKAAIRHQEHAAIVDAIMARDGRATGKAMRAHLELAIKRVLTGARDRGLLPE